LLFAHLLALTAFPPTVGLASVMALLSEGQETAPDARLVSLAAHVDAFCRLGEPENRWL
jgi:hypothetical protein